MLDILIKTSNTHLLNNGRLRISSDSGQNARASKININQWDPYFDIIKFNSEKHDQTSQVCLNVLGK